MAKAEISWTRVTAEGEKLQCYAQRVGGEYIFYSRAKRYDQWQEIEDPPLEDWLELLDAIQRLIPRMRVPPVEEVRVKKMIRDRFPEVRFPDEKP